VASSSKNGVAHAVARISWPLAGLGAVSGGLSWGALALLDALGIDFALLPRQELPFIGPLSTLPGLVFGLFFGAALIRRRGVGGGQFVGYVLASGVGYLAAYHAAFFSVLGVASWSEERNMGLAAWMVGGLLGGLAGSFVLGLISRFLLRVPWAEVLGVPLVAGTLAGAALLLMYFDSDSHGMPISLLVFFAFWQAAYAASLAPLLRAGRGAG
jgi:hypothetical protein